MTLFWLMWVGLVLGGLIASLWYQELRRGACLCRPARVAVRKADAREPGRRLLAAPPTRAEADFWPPLRVATRSAPPPGRPAG